MPQLSRRLFLGAGVVVCGCAGLAQAFAQTPAPAPAAPPGTKYVCPPCGCTADGKEFDAPGPCPDQNCGMQLIPKAPPSTPAPRGVSLATPSAS